MKNIFFCSALFLLCFVSTNADNVATEKDISGLPLWENHQPVTNDWLLGEVNSKAQLYRTPEGLLVLSNGLVSRSFTLEPNVACVSLNEERHQTSFLRAVRPEGSVTIDGMTLEIGGLEGQPIQNYLQRDWLPQLKATPGALSFTSYTIHDVQQRFAWKQHPEWMPQNAQWPVPGKELTFSFVLKDAAVQALKEKYPDKKATDLSYLQRLTVEVHYELYDKMPVFCKWISIKNNSGREITINHFKSEILAATEPESTVDDRQHWLFPNITLNTEYNFGGMSEEYIYSTSVKWKPDSLYLTQVNYARTMPCLLEAAPTIGPDQRVVSGEEFSSFRLWELLNDSWDRERRSLAFRKMMRALAPWTTENPVLMHVRQANDKAVKHAIDQCADVGFEMIILTFGSGFNAEDTTATNIARLKALSDYAKSKGIALGGYSLLASRSIDKDNDVVLPAGQSPRFGHSPCLESVWGQAYFKKLYTLYEQTGMQVLEHDGSYPGDLCYSTSHPGHRGVSDSQWTQFKEITDFYKWCRSKGIYLNVPDLYFLNGSNKTGMGYREADWSLPREQQEIIERQNIYDGTWLKAPSMGWMFVPLVEYQGGGEAATIEPLHEHLSHYGQRLANLFGAGVQACYRGPELYDTPETRTVVKRWVDFYKRHRQVLDADIIHVRRPDGQDYDALLHVNPVGKEKALLMVYNPLRQTIHRKINVSLYYAGLRKKASISEQEGKWHSISLSPDCEAEIELTIPAKSQTWVVFK
jgi:hypothetical protein